MRRTVTELLMNVFDLSAAEVEKNLMRDQSGKWDSLAHMDLITSLEKEYHLSLTIDEMIGLDSFDSVRTLLREKGVSN